MNGHRDVIAKGMVVEKIDGEEEEYVDTPPAKGNLVRGNEEGRPALVKLGHVSRRGYEDELDERDQGSWIDWQMSLECHRTGALDVPLAGSKLFKVRSTLASCGSWMHSLDDGL